MNVVTTPSPATPGIPPSFLRSSRARRTRPSLGPPRPGTITRRPSPRYFTLLDDISFASNGQPDTTNTFVQRGDRYTWAYMLHKLEPFGAPSTSVNMDLMVVVYANRATSVPGGEATYAAAGNVNDTAVTLFYAGTPPDIRRGSWILDTSFNPVTNSVHGDFYRVVSVTPTPVANQLNLELQTTISKPISAVTVMDNVVDVFERGTGDSSKWEFRNN